MDNIRKHNDFGRERDLDVRRRFESTDRNIKHPRLHKPGSPMIKSCTSAKLNNNFAISIPLSKLLSKTYLNLSF